MKKVISTLIVCVMLLATVLACSACTVGGKFGKMTITVTYYSLNKQTGEYTATDKTETVSVKLHKHVAPVTCDRLQTLAKEKFFEGAVFYKNTNYSSQVMIGDLFYKEGKFTEKIYGNRLTATPDNPYAMEFDKSGVKGNNLSATEGNIALWRDLDRNSDLTFDNSATYGNGASTLFIPTGTTNYTGYVAVFGELEKSFTDFMKELKKDLADSDKYTSYTVYSIAVEEDGAAKKGEDHVNYVLDGNQPAFNILPTDDLGSVKGYNTYVDENDDPTRTVNTNLWVNAVKYYIPVEMAVITSVTVK